ncbi:glutathione S-transferase family protein [Sphingomonas sp. ABOLD]|uniref:Glutathione S-transferase n=1 Tax=Sphingomonas trueperi TaxID=53317 RepID=A0A7X6BEA1_9SPHN|nr:MULTISPECIES: glutathione S-transferase family protein [Sphingomonas]NJB98701.1 glutathione S-transferase [Sphingomonas trueperi]RSV43929.1 glutathione S-transferase family protein [Sphingomonas sp. ABOLE]RSV45868.1 glutathione S-transferase family protein [Sphingomonas sp. ABOLD]
MADELILYTNPQSRGRIARWMLEEVGATYRVEVLDYASTMKGDTYLAINPMGKVPAIVHGGKVVTECAAICAYLAEAFPDAGLAPLPQERADYYRWLFYAAGPVEQATTNNFAKFESGEQSRMFGYGNYDLVVDVLDGLLSSRAYVTGDRFTAADVYLGSQIGWTTLFGMLPKRDSFLAYLERVQSREAYKRAWALDDADAEAQKAAEPA